MDAVKSRWASLTRFPGPAARRTDSFEVVTAKARSTRSIRASGKIMQRSLRSIGEMLDQEGAKPDQ
jgi:hypothetical protein